MELGLQDCSRETTKESTTMDQARDEDPLPQQVGLLAALHISG